ncbi:MAG: hypothetical protein AB2A00_03300 [Myxococcota bacterium]
MTRGGNDDGGYSIAYDHFASALRLQVWGFWPDDVAGQFADAMMGACQKVLRPVVVRADATHLKPQRLAGQEAWRRIFIALQAGGLSRAIILCPNALTRLQLQRLIKETDASAWSCVTSDAEAAVALHAGPPREVNHG